MRLSELIEELDQARDWAEKTRTDPEIRVDWTRTIERVTFEMTPHGAVLLVTRER